MNEPQKTKSGWRIVRRILIALAVLATLIAIFYTEEDWRGKHDWQNCKRQLEAQGVVLDWDKLIPPPVPDDQNFFKAPRMAKWFEYSVAPRYTTHYELKPLMTNALLVATITNAAVAMKFLAWSDQFQPDFDLMREALKRPYARMEGDYTKPYDGPIVNFVDVRAVAQFLTQRAKCDMLLGQPDKALTELTLLNDSRRIMEHAPTGKPMSLVDAMVNVAVTGLYADTIADGLQQQAWQEPQLIALQQQLERIDLPSLLLEAFDTEPAAVSHDLETMPTTTLAELFFLRPNEWKLALWPLMKSALLPRGWIYQNMITVVRSFTEGFHPANDTIHPEKIEEVIGGLHAVARPYKFIAVKAIPNFTKAWQSTAYQQTLVNEAQIACALERYRLAYGTYPETLDALTPRFMETIPHDLIGGQPLHYRLTDDGKFLLYSIGWNEIDDGGKEGPHNRYGITDYSKGDWVWPATAK